MQMNIFDQRSLDEKIRDSIERIKTFAPKNEPAYVAFSGGKDSIVLKKLVEMSSIQATYHYNFTTVDPPELVATIRQHHPEVVFNYPEKSMYQLLVSRASVPTRLARYCCEYLKENGGNGRTVMTGVRWAESPRRAANTKLVRRCVPKSSTIINPILDWSDDEVWKFIREMKLPYCSLYDEGFTRLGCIGCPIAGPANMAREFERWPGFLRMYYRAIEKFLPVKIARRLAKGKPNDKEFLQSPKAFMLWWLYDTTKDKRHEATVSALIDKHCIKKDETCK